MTETQGALQGFNMTPVVLDLPALLSRLLKYRIAPFAFNLVPGIQVFSFRVPHSIGRTLHLSSSEMTH